MTVLVAGQNIGWPHAEAEVRAPGVALGMVPLGADDRWDPAVPVLRADGGVRLTLTAVPDGVERLLVIGSAHDLVGRVAIADGQGAEVASFAVVASGLVALVEIYRRAGAWKVRAVGQAYAGIADLERLHGVRWDEPGAPHATPAPAPAPPPEPTVGSVDPDRAVQLVGMIMEDAARSGASYTSSVTYADSHLEREDEAIVADPALRISEEGTRAREAARARRDDLVRRAQEVHLKDLAHLRGELVDVEASLPPAARRWPAVTPIRRGEDLPTAARAGDITLTHLADVPGAEFSLPMLWRIPGRPLIVTTDGGGEAAATAVAMTIGVRAVAALGRFGPRFVISDLGGHRGPLGLPPGLAPGAVTAAPALTRVLAELVRRGELIEVARQGNALDALDDELMRPVVLVLIDVPTLWEAETLPLLDRLVATPPAGVQVILTGPDRSPRAGSPAEQRLLEAIWGSALRLPSARGGQLADSFAGVSWTFLPDLGPTDADVLARLLGEIGPIEGWREGIVPAG